MEFATLRRDALLLYNTAVSGRDSEEFLALEILAGHVRFSFSLGAGSISRLTVPQDVATGGWHKVIAERDGKVCGFVVLQVEKPSLQQIRLDTEHLQSSKASRLSLLLQKEIA